MDKTLLSVIRAVVLIGLSSHYWRGYSIRSYPYWFIRLATKFIVRDDCACDLGFAYGFYSVVNIKTA